MKQSFVLVPILAMFVACGPSKAEFESLKTENAALHAQVDSLSKELDKYKYSPDKLLADAKNAAKKGDKWNLSQIVSQLKQYHPQSKESTEAQNLLDGVIAAEKAKAEKERLKAEREQQERLKVVKKLKKNYDSVQGITWYENPYYTHYNNRNLVSIYMGKNSSSIWLRLKMSYTGDNWIFFDHAYLSYDGVTREIYFDKYKDKKSDNSGGDVWEWIDVNVSEEDLAFLKKMVNGKSVKMQLSGKYTKTRTVSANEVKAIKEMIMAYEVLEAED